MLQMLVYVTLLPFFPHISGFALATLRYS